MGIKIGLIIYFILQLIAFVLVLIGTPLEMFQAKKNITDESRNCITLWGFKQKCRSSDYDIKNNDLWKGCTGRRDRFRAAEAFSIVSIVVYGVACVLGFIQLCCCRCFRWLCLVLNIVGIGTGCVTWAIMVEAYYSQSNGYICDKLKTTMKYGAGFGLFLAGWGANLIAIPFLLIPI